MRRDVLKLDLGIFSESDVSVVPAEVFVIVGVVVTQYLAFLRMVVLEPVELPARIRLVGDRKHLHPTAGDGAIEFKGVTSIHLTFYVL